MVLNRWDRFAKGITFHKKTKEAIKKIEERNR
jgi:hypothetical protein